MKTIYITGDQWQTRALQVEPVRAADSAAPRAGRRRMTSGSGKVVDLAAWRAEHLTELDEPEAGRVSALGQYGGRELIRRQRRSTEALNRAELAATLAVAAALLALAARVLLF